MAAAVQTCEGPHQRLVYSVEGAVEQLSISKTVLYELIAAGRIPVIHYGEGRRRVGITHQALVAFVDSRIAEELAAAS
jgi:excisionase family DNA binding protein